MPFLYSNAGCVQALGCLMLVVVVMVVVGLSMRLHPGPSWRGVSPELRVLNFNVQQGFSRKGSVNYDAIYNMLDAERPHIITYVLSHSSPSLYQNTIRSHPK